MVSLPDPERIHFNPEVLYAKLALGRRCYALGSFDYAAQLYPHLFPGEELDLASQVESLGELGFDGLKVFLGKPGFQQRAGLRLTDPPSGAGVRARERPGPACPGPRRRPAGLLDPGPAGRPGGTRLRGAAGPGPGRS